MELEPATKFLGNSQFKQLCHITSEVWECWKAFIKCKINPTGQNDLEFSMEIIDVQISCQTMLEGPMAWGKWSIVYLRDCVKVKNNKRGYYKAE